MHSVVDVWLVRVAKPSSLDCWRDFLDAAEQKRLDRFSAADAAFLFLTARVLLRNVLSRMNDVDPRDWRFSTNEFGRPFIATPADSELVFNLSHTEGLVACAIGRSCLVGIDAEWAERRTNVEELVSHVLHPTERLLFRGASVKSRRELFFTYWTLKEAYLKARGLGFSLPPTSVAFDLSGHEPKITLTDEEESGPWSFRCYRPTATHHLALAIGGASAEVDPNVRWCEIRSDGTLEVLTD
ncbi:MAG: 4'-phosphopantetheinyl transferase superfamily protein [Pseudomonadota bacterium]